MRREKKLFERDGNEKNHTNIHTHIHSKTQNKKESKQKKTIDNGEKTWS